MYSLKYKVTTSTCDSEGKLKLYSALQMMQDCSEMWIDSEPEVKDYFLQQNMAQLLATRQVEIIRVPDYKEELTVTTSVYGMKPMFGFRNTFIYDAHSQYRHVTRPHLNSGNGISNRQFTCMFKTNFYHSS